MRYNFVMNTKFQYRKVSIIVPVYNCEKYILRCVNSLLNQTYKNTEILLIDDGSTDNSLEICNYLSKENANVHVFHKINEGLSATRNFGIEKAKGDYIGFVDSDDYVSIDFYERLVELLENHEDSIASANIIRFFEDETRKIIFKMGNCHLDYEEFLKNLLLHKGDVSVCNKLFPTNLIKKYRFQENKLNEDLLFFFSFKFVKIYYANINGYYYFCRKNSISNAFEKGLLDMGPNSIMIYEKVLKEFPTLSKQALRFAMVQNLYFLLKFPINDMEKYITSYTFSLDFLKRNKKTIVNNKYISKKDLLYIFFLCLNPIKFLTIYHLLRKKK